MMLILCCLSFTASAQIDTTKLCFTRAQVKEFLFTKVELNKCSYTLKIQHKRINELTEQKEEILEDKEKADKKLKRTRIISGGSGGLALLMGLLLVFRK